MENQQPDSRIAQALAEHSADIGQDNRGLAAELERFRTETEANQEHRP